MLLELPLPDNINSTSPFLAFTLIDERIYFRIQCHWLSKLLFLGLLIMPQLAIRIFFRPSAYSVMEIICHMYRLLHFLRFHI